MVAMLSYSQVTSYTVSLPPMKLKAGILIKAAGLEEEFKGVFTKGISLFEDAARFLKKKRSQFTNSNLGYKCALEFLSNIEELLKHERCGFEENIRNSFDEAKTIDVVSQKPLRLNRMRWELLLHAVIWNYRLQSLVLSDRLLSSSGKRKSNVSSSNGQHIFGWDEWFWTPFEELQSKRVADVEKEYLLNFENVNSFTQDNLQTVNQIIAEEGSRLHISLKDDGFIVSDYEDELSSLIACSLAKLSNDEKKLPPEGFLDKDQYSKQIVDDEVSHISSEITNWLETLSPPEVLVTFGSLKAVGNPNYSVVCLYADDFRDLRKRCFSSELDYIASLSRCKPFDAMGGKRKSVFVKTLDDRLIVKEIKKTEYESFVKFAPVYFKYMYNSYALGNQTCLAKVLGIHQVSVKSGKEILHYLMVMENLSFGRKITRMYDLKGSVHDRLTKTSANGAEDVLLDQNFVNDMDSSPLYISITSKRDLLSAVYNDTSFLTSINVMDYSLFVGVDNESNELVCGITDYLTQYTWEQHLETWVKSCCLISKNVHNPIDYMTRFRKFMNTNFMHLPNTWCNQGD